MSGLPDSHAKDGLKYDPIVTGSFVYALLTVLGLACVFGAKGIGKLESKEVGMSLVFVATAGVCMWIVYISTWMVRVRALFCLVNCEWCVLQVEDYSDRTLLGKGYVENLGLLRLRLWTFRNVRRH